MLGRLLVECGGVLTGSAFCNMRHPSLPPRATIRLRSDPAGSMRRGAGRMPAHRGCQRGRRRAWKPLSREERPSAWRPASRISAPRGSGRSSLPRRGGSCWPAPGVPTAAQRLSDRATVSAKTTSASSSPAAAAPAAPPSPGAATEGKTGCDANSATWHALALLRAFRSPFLRGSQPFG